VILLHSSPAYRTASPAPRWTPHTRLSPAPTPQESAPPVVVWSDPAPRFSPTDTTRPPIITEIADTSESDPTPPLPAIAATNLPPTEPAPAAATRDLTDWLIRLNQQLREEDRQRIAGTASTRPEPRRLLRADCERRSQMRADRLVAPPSFRFPPLREGNRPLGSPCLQGEP
jgi:hypothetical protein